MAKGTPKGVRIIRNPAFEAAHPRGPGGKFAKKGTGGGKEGISPAGRAALEKARRLVRVAKPKPAAKKPAAKGVRVAKLKPPAETKAKGVRVARIKAEGGGGRLPLMTRAEAERRGYAGGFDRSATRADAEAKALSSAGHRQGTAEFAVVKGRGDKPWTTLVRQKEYVPPPDPVLGTPAAPADVPHGGPERLASYGAAVSHARKVAGALSGIPAALRNRVAANGLTLAVGRKTTDIEPELANQQPRGHAQGRTWEQLDGFYDPSSRRVAVASHHAPPADAASSGGRDWRAVRPREVAMHEYGHGVDDTFDPAGGRLSLRPEFVSAYEADAAAVSPGRRESLAYFLQAGTAGKSEAFAEGFAALYGGQHLVDPGDFISQFPRTMKVVAGLTGGV